MSAVRPRTVAAGPASGHRPVLAFCEDAQADAVREALTDPGDVVAAGFDAALDALAGIPTPDIVIVDLGLGDVRESVARLAGVCDADAKVILMGRENDVALYRELIAMGVAEYLVRPARTEDIRDALHAAQSSSQAPAPAPVIGQPDTPATVISVTGARGGVGATMLAVNLAWTFAHRCARRVALVDLDLVFGGVALDLDIDPGPGLVEALARPDRLDELFVKRASAQVAPNLRVLAGEADPAAAPEPTHGAVEALLESLKGEVDTIVLDLPRGVAARHRDLYGLVDTALIVADPTLKAMRDTARIKALAAEARSIQAVLNRVGQTPKSELTPSAFETEAGVGVAARVPFDAGAARSAEAEGVCLARAAHRSKPVKAMTALAEALAGPDGATARPGLLRRLVGAKTAPAARGA